MKLGHLSFVAAAVLLTSISSEAEGQDFATGLRRAILTEGAPAERLSITERMARWHVPGLSVTIVDGCRIVDSRSFGVTQANGPSIDPETLFQAASISKPVAALAALRLGLIDIQGFTWARLRDS